MIARGHSPKKATGEPTYLTPPEVGARLRVSADKVLQWIHSGRLKAINVARDSAAKRPRYRVHEADLAAFLAARSSISPAAKERTRRRADSSPIIEYF